MHKETPQNMNLLLFAQPGREESVKALNQLKEAFPEATINVINASQAMTEIYSCPFVQEEGANGAFYGMSGIETFIRFRLVEALNQAHSQREKKPRRKAQFKPTPASA